LQWFRKSSFIVDGVKIYDPRECCWEISDNPALVMADMARMGEIKTSWKFDEEFWDKIGKLADFCDGEMT